MKTALFLVYLLTFVLGFSACDQARQSQPIGKPGLDVVATATSKPILPLPTSTRPAIPSPESGVISPLLENADNTNLVKYQHLSGYGIRFPQFEVLYDPTVWEFREDSSTPDNDYLVSRSDLRCLFILNAGATDAPRSAPVSITLAGRQWTYQVGLDSRLSYATPFEGGAYYFDVVLPEKYDVNSKSVCQQLAEVVINTFSLVNQ